MNSKITAYVENLFQDAPKNDEMKALKDELLSDLSEHFEDLLRQGMTEAEAYRAVTDSVGDIRELFPEEAQPAGRCHRESFDAAAVRAIRIHYISERIDIGVSDTGKIEFFEDIRPEDESLYATVKLTDGVLTIEHGRRTLVGPFFRARVQLRLPAEFHGMLQVGNTSGSIRMDGSYRLSQLELASVSGSIMVGDVEAERLDLNTVSGAIRGERLAGRWTIHSTSGSVSLDRAGGGGECSTTSGAIRMNISPLEYDLRCSTISGRINLQIPRGFRLNARTFSGKVSVGGPLQQNGRRVSGIVGDSAEHLVEVSSISGSIAIN